MFAMKLPSSLSILVMEPPSSFDVTNAPGREKMDFHHVLCH